MISTMFPLRREILALGMLASCLVLPACKKSSDAEGKKRQSATPAKPSTQRVEPAAPKLTKLNQYSLTSLANSLGVVALPDNSLRQAVLLDTGYNDNGKSSFVVFASVPDQIQEVTYMAQAGTLKAIPAKRIGTLPCGLAMFSFQTNQGLYALMFKRHASKPGKQVHAVRLSSGEPLTDVETGELRALLNQLTEEDKRMRADRARQRAQYQPGYSQPERDTDVQVQTAQQIQEAKSKLALGLKSLSPAEIATGTQVSDLSGSAQDWDNTVLIGADLQPFAIRHQDKWINLDEALDAAPSKATGVKLAVNGYNTNLNIDCAVQWTLPPTSGSYSLVAATTYELEMAGGGSLQERLARIQPQPFPTTPGSQRKLTKQVTWDGKPTTLWIRVIDDQKPDQPIIDEAISVRFSNGLIASWAKPPSALIELPQQQADTPEDLVKDRNVLDMGGTVLDMIATRDGSALLVQTDKPPFWKRLNLKSGTVADVPWKSTADTLVAHQAGINLVVNRKTKVVEIWDDAAEKRVGARLLNEPGDIISIAAPLESAKSPVLVTTTQSTAFLDPDTLKSIHCGFDFASFYTPNARQGNHLMSGMQQGSIRARASTDGSVYTLTSATPNTYNSLRSLVMRMADGLVSSPNTESARILTGNGRNQTDSSFPDHGGKSICAFVNRSNGAFPQSSASIGFKRSRTGGNTSTETLRSVAYCPPMDSEATTTPVAFDRRMYLDTRFNVLLIPEGGNMHLIHLRYPDTPPVQPDFVFTGEKFRFPLPRGTGHQVTSNVGGQITMTPDEFIWQVPEGQNTSHAELQLHWNGELGSPMNLKFRFNVVSSQPQPTITYATGSQPTPLRRRTVIPQINGERKFAGSGNIILGFDHPKVSAWNLIDGKKLCSVDCQHSNFFGDADRLYIKTNDTFMSYDLSTGNKIQARSLMSMVENTSHSVQTIATGNSSRGKLLATISLGGKNILAEIDRDTFNLSFPVFSTGTPVSIFSSSLASNATGSVFIGFTEAIFREGNRFTIKPAGANPNSIPDASGRFIFNSSTNTLVDISGNAPKIITAAELGKEATGRCFLAPDQSGRFLMVVTTDDQKAQTVASVRKLADGLPEVCRIQLKQSFSHHDGGLFLISSTKTLLVRNQNLGYEVYDLSCDSPGTSPAQPK